MRRENVRERRGEKRRRKGRGCGEHGEPCPAIPSCRARRIGTCGFPPFPFFPAHLCGELTHRRGNVDRGRDERRRGGMARPGAHDEAHSPGPGAGCALRGTSRRTEPGTAARHQPEECSRRTAPHGAGGAAGPRSRPPPDPQRWPRLQPRPLSGPPAAHWWKRLSITGRRARPRPAACGARALAARGGRCGAEAVSGSAGRARGWRCL